MSPIQKLLKLIQQKIQKHQRGLYLVLVLPIAFSCLITFASARLISIYWPWYYVQWAPGLHVHHFAYGFFVLAISGYLSLILSGPRAKFLISLLYGSGLGLAFDEFAMWIHLREDDIARWQYDGIILVFSVFVLLITLQPGLIFLIHHLPFTRKKLIAEHKKHQKISWDERKFGLNKTTKS